jgi:hypothetical protein
VRGGGASYLNSFVYLYLFSLALKCSISLSLSMFGYALSWVNYDITRYKSAAAAAARATLYNMQFSKPQG